ncbi:hypothetical protein [Sandarakinorhabdus sp. DWP1-3-1]|uniref:hypothetical protein n=1 Tax=Sandarakinorhabdus sp. DWP1-3-1 TaxID=2804627 RepID=UPI003CE69621
MKMRAPILFVFIVLAGCATPAQRIARKLGEYGVPPRQAQCMGDRLQSRLSLAQLRRLDEIGKMLPDGGRRLSVGDIAQRLGDPRDPTVVIEVVKAGVGCAI